MQLNAEHRIPFYLIRMCIQDRIEDCAWDGRTQLEIGGRKTDDHILPMGNDTLFHLTFTLHEDRPAVICQDGSSKKLIEPYDGLWIVPSSLADIAVGVFFAPEEAVLTFSLQPETERMIGRSASTDIRLSHRSVSKSNAVIARSTRYEIFDMQSSMGTYVNGRRVQRKELKAGDEITIGITIFCLTAPASTLRRICWHPKTQPIRFNALLDVSPRSLSANCNWRSRRQS